MRYLSHKNLCYLILKDIIIMLKTYKSAVKKRTQKHKSQQLNESNACRNYVV